MINEEKLTEKFCYGQKMIKRKGIGKPAVAYIVTHTAGYDTLVKMSPELPYIPGKDKPFFVHIENLRRLWFHPGEGRQLNLSI